MSFTGTNFLELIYQELHKVWHYFAEEKNDIQLYVWKESAANAV